MSSQSQDKDNKFRPADNLDAQLQQELDEALGDMSLEELVAAEEAAVKAGKGEDVQGAKPRPAGVRRGTVVAIQGDDIFVDMGGKSQGMLSATAFDADEPLPAVGQSIDVTIESYDNTSGLLVLSRQGAVMAAAWETIQEGQLVEGRVTGLNKGGLELKIDGLRAFMPISQVELYHVEDLTPYLNMRLRCQVIEVDREEKNVIVSRRAILELEAAEQREKTFQSLVEGKTVRGVVKTIMPYGAFVDIGGVDGLLHVKDMSHARIDDPKTIVKEGQQLELMVLKVDRDARKIALGLKQVLPDPWADIESKYSANTVVNGRVVRLADFGAFVELESGVDGLVPISEITFERRIKHPSEIVNVGDVVRVRVLSIDKDRKRISLSIKKAGDDPWMGAATRWPANTIIEGVVKRITEFGAFVEITPGVEGLVHISEISSSHVRKISDAIGEGQLVRAKVLGVEEDRRRISLSIKQVSAVPDYTAPVASAEPEEAPKPQPKRKKPLKGGLD